MILLLVARGGVLALSEQRVGLCLLCAWTRLISSTVIGSCHSHIATPQMVASLHFAPLVTLNLQITHHLILSVFNNMAKTVDVELLYPYIVSCLPPTRPSFDLMGRLIPLQMWIVLRWLAQCSI